MSKDSLTLVISEGGEVVVEGRAAQRRLAARPGNYRLLPSPANLVVLERAEEEAPAAGRTALAGDIERMGGLIDIIHFISQSTWSGQLTVLGGAFRKSIYFKRGEVRTASSNVPEDRIGAILYRYGRIGPGDLERAVSQASHEQRFGQILVDNGTLTQHDLYQFVRKQVEEIFFSVLVARQGEYYFYRTGDGEVPPSQLQLSTKHLLFEGVRRIDELSYFREKLPGPDVVLSRREPPPADKLPPREARVLSFIDGERDLGELARISHLGDFETTKICFQLLAADWVAVREKQQMVSRTNIHTQQTLRRVVETFNDAYARIFATARDDGREEAVRRGLESFFQSTADYAPLFVAMVIDADGRLAVDQLLANLAMAPATNRLDYLNRGLRELLFFQLFSAGESVDRADELALHEKLQQILQEMPEPASVGPRPVSVAPHSGAPVLP